MGGRAFTLAELALGTGAVFRGDGQTLIRRCATLASAGPGDIAFLSNPRYRAALADCRASAVIVAPESAAGTSLPALLHANPYACFARVASMLDPTPAPLPGVHPTATVAADAVLGEGVSIGPHTVVGAGAVIGPHSVLHAHVTVCHGVRIGARAILHPQSVIGSDGFGIAREDGRWIKIPQTGTVVLGDDVEVGAGTTIDRGALDDTVIGDGVKFDNQIQVGHNVRIGAHTALAGCVGIAGSAVVGAHCEIGGGAIILGHLEICDKVRVSAGTLVTKSIRTPGVYSGAYPFGPHREWLKGAAQVRHLDLFVERIDALELRIRELEGKA